MEGDSLSVWDEDEDSLSGAMMENQPVCRRTRESSKMAGSCPSVPWRADALMQCDLTCSRKIAWIGTVDCKDAAVQHSLLSFLLFVIY